MIKRFLLRWMVNFFGLWAAAELLSSRINYGERISVLIIAALIFSAVNALIRPLVVLFTLPAIVFTLGLFTLVVNGFMLYLVTVFYHKLHITNFWADILAALIIATVNYLLNDLLEPESK